MVHGNESEAELRAIVRAAYDAGFEGVTLHPYSYEDYLGPGQWDRWKIILDQARRLGLVVWQQDDRNYPSGFAMGKVVAAHPEFGRTRLVEAAQHSLTGPQKDFSLDIQPLLQGRDFLVAVSAYPENGEPLDLTDRVADGKLAWDVPAGKWRLFVVKAVWCGPMPVADSHTPMPFVDLMNPRATDAYIQTIYQATFDHFGPEFGRTFKGFFSDEAPVDFTPVHARLPRSVREEQGLLASASGCRRLRTTSRTRDKKIRFDYRDFIREQIAVGLLRPFAAVVPRSRHPADRPRDRRPPAGHAAAGIASTFPGFDNVFGQWYDPDPDVYWRMPRMASSVAHYAGSRNDVALIEHFAATGWRTGLVGNETHDGLVDRDGAQPGRSVRARHAIAAVVGGHARLLAARPQSAVALFSGIPGGGQPHDHADARRPSRRPGHRARHDRKPMGHGRRRPRMRNTAPATICGRSCAAMSQAHVDFDLIPYYVFADGARTTFDKGRVRIGKEDYRAVVVPGVEFIPAAVVERLRDSTTPAASSWRSAACRPHRATGRRTTASVRRLLRFGEPTRASGESRPSRPTTSLETCLTRLRRARRADSVQPEAICSTATANFTAGPLFLRQHRGRARLQQTIELRGAHGTPMSVGSRHRHDLHESATIRMAIAGLRLRLGLRRIRVDVRRRRSRVGSRIALPAVPPERAKSSVDDVAAGADMASRQRRATTITALFTTEAKCRPIGRSARRHGWIFKGASQIISVRDQRPAGGEPVLSALFASRSAEHLRAGEQPHRGRTHRALFKPRRNPQHGPALLHRRRQGRRSLPTGNTHTPTRSPKLSQIKPFHGGISHDEDSDWMTACSCCLAFFSGAVGAAADELAKGFQTPPDAARPWVWWFWLNNNVSKREHHRRPGGTQSQGDRRRDGLQPRRSARARARRGRIS